MSPQKMVSPKNIFKKTCWIFSNEIIVTTSRTRELRVCLVSLKNFVMLQVFNLLISKLDLHDCFNMNIT